MTPGAQTVDNIYSLWLCHAIGDLMYGLACKSDTVMSFTATGVVWGFFVFFCVFFFLSFFYFGGGGGLGAKPHL